MRSFLHGAALVMLIATGVAIVPSTALADDDPPLRLVFLNSDPSDGDRAYNAVEAILEASNDLVLTDAEELLDAASDHGISLETFRSGDKRTEHKETFRSMLDQVEAEAILIIDIFGSGRTMQFVIIGPRGDELQDVRYTISGGKPTQQETIDALRKTFKKLVPEVRSYREEQREANQNQSADVDLLGEEDDRELTAKQRAIQEHRQNHSELTVGATPTVGMIFGRRSMVLETEADYSLDHASPFVGVGGEINGIFALLNGDRSAIGATVFGAYAPFSTIFTDGEGENITHASSFANVGADLKYIAGIGPDMRLVGLGGAELTTISIASNDAYTGHSYLNARAGAGLVYQIGDLAELHLEAAALPTLSAEMSGDALGPADFSVGFNGGGALHLTLFKPIDVSVGYDFHYYAVNFASPELDALGDESASTTDMYHVAGLMIGYGF